MAAIELSKRIICLYNGWSVPTLLKSALRSPTTIHQIKGRVAAAYCRPHSVIASPWKSFLYNRTDNMIDKQFIIIGRNSAIIVRSVTPIILVFFNVEFTSLLRNTKFNAVTDIALIRTFNSDDGTTSPLSKPVAHKTETDMSTLAAVVGVQRSSDLSVRMSTIVKEIPSIFSFGLIFRFIFEMECMSKSRLLPKKRRLRQNDNAVCCRQ